MFIHVSHFPMTRQPGDSSVPESSLKNKNIRSKEIAQGLWFLHCMWFSLAQSLILHMVS